MANVQPHQKAHELIDRMPPNQVAAVVGVLEAILDPVSDPVSIALSNAPIDDEPVSAAETREIADSRDLSARVRGVSHDEVLSHFGLTPDDFRRMAFTPIPAEKHSPGHLPSER